MTQVRKCAHCGRPQDEKYRPFCSKRCAYVDLNRWLSGEYKIAGMDDDEEDQPPRDDQES